MMKHAERRKLGYRPEQLFDLVADVERFTSRVVLDRPNLAIDVTYADGPFKHLTNRWRFERTAEGFCIIDFYVEFEFRSAMLQKLIGVLFHEAVKRMVAAFETRATALYGPPVDNH